MLCDASKDTLQIVLAFWFELEIICLKHLNVEMTVPLFPDSSGLCLCKLCVYHWSWGPLIWPLYLDFQKDFEGKCRMNTKWDYLRPLIWIRCFGLETRCRSLASCFPQRGGLLLDLSVAFEFSIEMLSKPSCFPVSKDAN